MTGRTKEVPKSTKAERTKARIRDCALELFHRQGFDATSVEEISKAAGLTKGAFYVHFESKYSLFPAFIDSLDLNYSGHYASLKAEPDALVALFRFTDIVLGLLEHRLGMAVLRPLYRSQVAGDVDTEHFVSKERDLFKIIRELLERAQREGLIKADLDCEAFTDHFIMTFRCMCFEWCARGPEFDLKKEAYRHFGYLFDGIRVEKHRA
jgi:AcrR family transcriptional regulator